MKNDVQSPLILSLESSGATCGVALSSGANLLGEFSFFTNNLHDKFLAELTRRMLADFSFSVESLHAVAVSAGPGSFTGVRIGVSFAKALCFDNRPKLLAVPTLSAFASAATEFARLTSARQICTLIPAQKNLLFVQYFSPNAEPQSEIDIKTLDEVQSTLRDDVVYCGTGAEKVPARLQLSGLNRLSPRFVMRHALTLFAKNLFVEPEDFAPLYVQDFTPTFAKKLG